MNKIIILMVTLLVMIIILLLAVGVFIFYKYSNTPINNSGVIHFGTEVLSKNNIEYLLVSGEVFTSYPISARVGKNRINDDIIINIYTALSKNPDVTFMYAVKLDNSVNRVLFGPDKKVIWERGK